MNYKSFVSGAVILGAIIGAWYVIKLVAFLAWLFMPLIVLAVVLYCLGNFVPAEWTKAVEKNLKKAFDWLDFNAPTWSWPAIKFARGCLDWLNLHVK